MRRLVTYLLLFSSLCLAACSGGDDGQGDGGAAGDGGSQNLPPREQSPPSLIGGMFGITHTQTGTTSSLYGGGAYFGPTRIEPGQFPEYSYYSNVPLDECIRDITVITGQPTPIEGGPGILLEGPGGPLPMARVDFFGTILYQGEGEGSLFSPESEYTLSGGGEGAPITPFAKSPLYSPASITLIEPDLSQPVPYDASKPLAMRWQAAGDGEPVFVFIKQLEDGTETKKWICRFGDDGEAEIPTWVLEQFGGVTELFITLEVELSISKYRWSSVALDGVSHPALVYFASEWAGTVDVPNDF